ncbi:MAG: hypothetical protein F6K36_29710 [Symploca sp. SIO3C6]|nr:hypothetical protein [Symploca sp. SIO3C6]
MSFEANFQATVQPTIAALQSTIRAQQEEINQREEWLDELTAKCRHYEDAYSESEQRNLNEFEQSKSEYVLSLQDLREQREEIAQQREELYQSEVSLESREKQIKSDAMDLAIETVQGDLDALQRERDGLLERVQSLLDVIHDLRIPEFISGSTRADLIGNEVIRALKELSVVIIDPSAYTQLNNGNVIIVEGRVSPANPNGELANCYTTLSHVVPFLQKPQNLAFIQNFIPDCNTPPKLVAISGKKLRVVLDVSGVDQVAVQKEKDEQEKYFESPDIAASLSEFVATNNHICIMANSGSGKTTLLDNLIDLVYTQFQSQGEDNIKIRYANPKPARQYSHHTINWIGVEKSIFCLIEAAVEVVYRVAVNNQIAERNQYRDKEHQLAYIEWKTALIYVICKSL